jgi:hypothetical protein
MLKCMAESPVSAKRAWRSAKGKVGSGLAFVPCSGSLEPTRQPFAGREVLLIYGYKSK